MAVEPLTEAVAAERLAALITRFPGALDTGLDLLADQNTAAVAAAALTRRQAQQGQLLQEQQHQQMLLPPPQHYQLQPQLQPQQHLHQQQLLQLQALLQQMPQQPSLLPQRRNGNVSAAPVGEIHNTLPRTLDFVEQSEIITPFSHPHPGILPPHGSALRFLGLFDSDMTAEATTIYEGSAGAIQGSILTTVNMLTDLTASSFGVDSLPARIKSCVLNLVLTGVLYAPEGGPRALLLTDMLIMKSDGDRRADGDSYDIAHANSTAITPQHVSRITVPPPRIVISTYPFQRGDVAACLYTLARLLSCILPGRAGQIVSPMPFGIPAGNSFGLLAALALLYEAAMVGDETQSLEVVRYNMHILQLGVLSIGAIFASANVASYSPRGVLRRVRVAAMHSASQVTGASAFERARHLNDLMAIEQPIVLPMRASGTAPTSRGSASSSFSSSSSAGGASGATRPPRASSSSSSSLSSARVSSSSSSSSSSAFLLMGQPSDWILPSCSHSPVRILQAVGGESGLPSFGGAVLCLRFHLGKGCLVASCSRGHTPPPGFMASREVADFQARVAAIGPTIA